MSYLIHQFRSIFCVLLCAGCIICTSCSSSFTDVRIQNSLRNAGFLSVKAVSSVDYDTKEFYARAKYSQTEFSTLVEKLGLSKDLAKEKMLFVRPVSVDKDASFDDLGLPLPLEQIRSNSLYSEVYDPSGFFTAYMSGDGLAFFYFKGTSKEARRIVGYLADSQEGRD